MVGWTGRRRVGARPQNGAAINHGNGGRHEGTNRKARALDARVGGGAFVRIGSEGADQQPPPQLQGEPAVHAWSVPGVVSNSTLATLIACTNTLGSTVIVGVEVFGPAGGAARNDASATALAVAPGATVLFATAPAPFSADSVLSVAADKGSARVLVTTNSKASQQIICSAFFTDRNNDPPTSMTSLNVIRRNTQQGE